MQSLATFNVPNVYGIPNEQTVIAFPLRAEFSASARTEYRVILKHVGDYHRNSEIYVRVNDEIYSVRMNRQKEFNVIFLEETSKKMMIVFSGLKTIDGSPLSHPLIVSEIRIDQLSQN